MKEPKICIDELRDMLNACDGSMMAVISDNGLAIIDDDGNEVDFIAFY